jgi:hypothetical protein
MNGFHDPIRHIKYLRQSLSQDNEAIGFFISAGCPLAVEMPEDEWPLIPDVAALSSFINKQLQGDINYTLLLDELEKSGKKKNNIEDVLSFLRGLLLVSKGGTVRGLTEQNLIGLQDSICKEIVKKIHVTLPDEDTPYHRLCKWIQSIDRKVAVELFTTNYDLLMEQSLEILEIPYFDGFVGSTKAFFDLRAVEDNFIPIHWSRLWKIHGSINWYVEEKDDHKKVYRSSEVKEDASHLIYPSHLKYEESRKMPYLALIDQLNRFTRKKSSLLILCGYSFGDGHINDTIINALVANPTAMVLGLMFGTYHVKSEDGTISERYPKAYKLAKNQHNLNIWTFDKAIIGTNIGNWNKGLSREDADADVMSFISTKPSIENDKIMQDMVEMGNFSVFTTFLRKIIGTAKEKPDGK